MQINTRVFERIVQEAKNTIKRAAIKSIADTMEETVRFGCFKRPYVERCAEDRLVANMTGS